MGDGPAGEGARGTRPPPAATSTCPQGGEPAPGEEQLRGPGRCAAAQSRGSGGWPGPAWAGLGGCRLPGRPSLGDRPCWRSPWKPRPLHLFIISALFRKRGPHGRKCAETSRPADSGTEPARRGSATSSRWAGSASLGPGARAARAACPHEPLWNPAQPSGRLSLGFPPLGLRVSHFRIAHGPPRTAPAHEAALTGGPDRRRGRCAQPRLGRVPDGSLAASCSSRPRPPEAAGRAAGGTHSGLNPTGLCRPLPRAAQG